jgi:mannose-1-phosphate guanylyltransferase
MIIVIIAGGSGTRLWPLSQADYPKHLLKLTGEHSLLQNTYRRVCRLTDKIYVITEASHAEEVRKQLPELSQRQVIVEPARRGTASCFVLALATVYHQDKSDEPVVFLHADHHIVDEAGFALTVRVAAEASAQHQRITLIGIEPIYPATGFGYIEKKRLLEKTDGLEVSEVARFKEKPDLKTAEQFVKSGDYLWNMGQFAAPPSTYLQAFTKNAPYLADAYDRIFNSIGRDSDVERAYLELMNIAIEYALLEHMSDLLAVGGKFDWSDVGSFFDLHKLVQDRDQNSLQGDIELIDCQDVMIHGSDKPIVAIGLEGVVVVDSPNGLLVCAKDKAQLVGEAAKRLQKRTENKA